jgi:Domain of unknown function (DUF1906)
MRSLSVIKSLPFAVFCLVVGCLVIAAPPAGATSSSATSSSKASPSAARPHPAGSRTVSFDGVSVRVPASWPVVNLARRPRACPELDVHAVYLGAPGPDPECPASLAGRTTAVQLEPVSSASPDLRLATRHATVDGRAVLSNTDALVTHQLIDIVPSARVEISISYGASGAAARSIEKSAKITGSAAAVALGAPAAVRPAAVQGVVTGPGFDTCAAPSAATMKDWLASPYRSVGIYIGGVNRACAQSSLTAAWIQAIQAEGWHYFPMYVGLQAPCVAAFGDATISAGSAAAQGTAAASDAVTQAAGLGIPAGTPLIFDMEAYRGGCGATVTAFLSAWDKQLHAKGYSAGVYESYSNVGDLTAAASQITEPDVIHYADWDGQATTASSYMPAAMWTNHQRIHQYSGGHNESWGGATVNIDNDELDVALGGSGPAPEPPLAPAFRIATAMNSNGTAEWFAMGANGTVQHNYQHPIGSSAWWGTRAVGDSPDSLAGNPAVAADQGGALTIFARNTAGQIVHAWQQDGAPNDWQWGGAAGTGTAKFTSDPGAILAPGGDVNLFAATASGAVFTTRQTSHNANTSWTAWTSIGGDCAGTPVPFVTGGPKLQVFCVTRTGALDVLTLGPSGWGAWTAAGSGPAGMTGTPAVIAGPAGEPEVLVTAAGKLACGWVSATTGAWTWGTSPAGVTAVSNSPAVTAWPGDGIAVFARQANGQLGYAVQAGAAGTWSAWTPIGTQMQGSPAAWVNTGGIPEVAILNAQQQIAVSTYASGMWAPFTELGGGF